MFSANIRNLLTHNKIVLLSPCQQLQLWLKTDKRLINHDLLLHCLINRLNDIFITYEPFSNVCIQLQIAIFHKCEANTNKAGVQVPLFEKQAKYQSKRSSMQFLKTTFRKQNILLFRFNMFVIVIYVIFFSSNFCFHLFTGKMCNGIIRKHI